MKSIKRSIFRAAIIVLSLCAGCATQQPGVYRGSINGPVLVQPGPLDARDFYSFRFVDKWRISHAWLDGPTEIWPCKYLDNAFQGVSGYEGLAKERSTPFVERNNILYVVNEHKGIWYLSNRRESVYGTNPAGQFKSFHAFCGHVFKDSLDGVALLIIQPDPAKGTDEWIENAKPVTINGLHWLHKEIPIQDWSESRERSAAPIEYWVLKIPDTQYWLVLQFSASSGKKFGLGAGAYPEKHRRLLELFHQIVHSVRLEPITPVDISPLIKEIR